VTTPVAEWLGGAPVRVLDGGLATTLEARGHDLSDALWSARLLIDAPEEIAEVHRAFLAAGADCVTSASYQASFAGLERRGLGRAEARETLQRSVTLAREARDAWVAAGGEGSGPQRPLVAASVGPWGAAQADGSEYTGRYAIDEAGLEEFHRERFALLVEAGPDLIACETLPSRAEARTLLRLLDETPGVRAWFSFTAGDGERLPDGTPLAELARELDHERLVAIGVNCVPPGRVVGLLAALREGTSRPLVAYPNSGEGWDPVARTWKGQAAAPDARRPGAWRAAGASLIGGCCRVGPEAIRELRLELLGPESRTLRPA